MGVQSWRGETRVHMHESPEPETEGGAGNGRDKNCRNLSTDSILTPPAATVGTALSLFF